MCFIIWNYLFIDKTIFIHFRVWQDWKLQYVNGGVLEWMCINNCAIKWLKCKETQIKKEKLRYSYVSRENEYINKICSCSISSISRQKRQWVWKCRRDFCPCSVIDIWAPSLPLRLCATFLMIFVAANSGATNFKEVCQLSRDTNVSFS